MIVIPDRLQPVRNLSAVFVVTATQPHREIPHPTTSGFGMTMWGRATPLEDDFRKPLRRAGHAGAPRRERERPACAATPLNPEIKTAPLAVAGDAG